MKKLIEYKGFTIPYRIHEHLHISKNLRIKLPITYVLAGEEITENITIQVRLDDDNNDGELEGVDISLYIEEILKRKVHERYK